MLLLLLNYVVLRALWKIDVHLISTLVNKSLLLLLLHRLEKHVLSHTFRLNHNLRYVYIISNVTYLVIYVVL